MHESTAWKTEGLCADLSTTNPTMWARFFGETALERRPARNLCESCPVREQCLRNALEKKEIWGVWGGCDESEIRRALWVNAMGKAAPRCRFPHCPMCKGRPSRLYVISWCDTPSRRKRERVECSKCGFYWRAPSSVIAVKAYWRDYARSRRIKARAPQGRIPTGRPTKTIVPIYPRAVPEADLVALAASLRPA